ncbi:MAG: amino acid ABC transporter permease [Candidatus Limnocylindrales bacterium]
MTAERLPPPTQAIGLVAWLRRNLFGGWISSLITVLLAAAIAVFALAFANWAVNEARWGVVTENLRLFLIGRYPFDEAWRVWLSLMILSVLTGLSAGTWSGGAIRTLASWLAAGQALLAGLAAVSGMGPTVVIALLVNTGLVWLAFALSVRIAIPGRPLAIAWILSLPVSALLLQGTGGGLLPLVSTNEWGGLLLTFVLAIVGIALSFPFGVLLALGRRSDLPAIRLLSTAYIEIVRGVPLVTILFMAAIMLPLFLPGEIRVDRVLRALGGITLFSAAYVAENVRGGLQAIPSGQIEASNAIGLNVLQRNLYVVLPQALRAVIPANVGLFISLLKDTTLVAIVGLLEILGIGRAVLAQSQWFGAQLEVYVFIAIVFFILCYTMSQASYRLEAQLGVGKR